MSDLTSKDNNSEAGADGSGENLALEADLEGACLFAKADDEELEESSSLWLITFTDIMALMLTFFVLLYSMTEPEEKKWSDMTAAINKELGQYRAPVFNEGVQDTININKISFKRALDLSYLANIISSSMRQAGLGESIAIAPQKESLILSLPEDLFFSAGSSQVNLQGQQALYKIGDVLMRIRNAIEVVGHADPRQPRSEEVDSNWLLSLNRATHVAGVLENVGYTRPFIVRGMSSARYDDLPAELSEEKRQDLSRRVDIVILKNDGDLREVLKVE